MNISDLVVSNHHMYNILQKLIFWIINQKTIFQQPPHDDIDLEGQESQEEFSQGLLYMREIFKKDKNLAKALYQKYKIDFLAFNYTIDHYFD